MARKGKATVDKPILDLSIQDIQKIEAYLKILKEKATTDRNIPLSIFEKKCSAFESITRYLIEKRKLSYKETATLLHRTPSTIGVTYKNAKRKSKIDFSAIEIAPSIEVEFSKKSVIESLIIALSKEYSTKDIARTLHRHYNTIYTIQNRGNK